MTGSMVVVSAHAADYVWRAGGTIAKYVQMGWEVNILVLSMGVRGESAELWRAGNQTYEKVESARREESMNAAEVLGCKLHFFSLEDYRITITSDVLNDMARHFREFQPSIIVTHGREDPFNPDHPIVHQATVEARLLAGSPGVMPDLGVMAPTRLYAFEPHQPEMSGFIPDILIDVTDVFETKMNAMKCVPTQAYLVDFHQKLAEARGYHARRNWSNKDIQYAEAFQSYLPIVSDMLP